MSRKTIKKSVLARVRKDITDNCANCIGRNKCCFHEVCKYFLDNPEQCAYYEGWVLPANPELENAYKAEFGTLPKKAKKKNPNKIKILIH
ncbi:hypothetical protein H1R82_14410 [Thermoactinomyces intermedius]|uniref:Uncharacterized protein n=2 Tax=Thermoactinomyces TaxID=2023 RepID=A0A8I1DDM3_THEIN|nr:MULTISPECIES: hypothetical protein [Thermoactinomyces]MBA4547729.1 hypothetical protein [Thermoactinomyces intermedius]MBA4552607.1 hypothetical protein [Thermoactinomyces vulgaris]MBA4837807.1 hypothetical protein [Thermoactinomyces intermedius]MBH8589753.1 hypothetical protein [Thermoactinomyces vulgaris]MBH8594042.1 hypothetical protein [Thermoactinomyces intermedius]